MADGLECMRPLRGMLRTIDTLTAGGVPWLLDRPRRHADEEAGAARSYWDVTVTAVARTVRVLRPLSALQRNVDSAAPFAYVCHSRCMSLCGDIGSVALRIG